MTLQASLDLAGMSEDDRAFGLAIHRLGVEGWLKAYLRAQALINQSMRRLEAQGLAAEVALLSQVLKLQALALKATTGSPMQASSSIARDTEQLLRRIEKAYRASVVAALEDATPAFREQLSLEIRADLHDQHLSEMRAVQEQAAAEVQAVREQFELLESAATSAQADASAADRRVRELERELKKAQFDAEKFSARVREQERVPGLEADLAAERAAHAQLRSTVLERDRQTREREATLTRQVSSLSHRAHDLEQQLAATQAALTSAQAAAPAPRPQEPIMSRLSPVQHDAPTPLEAASLCVYLKAQGIPATWSRTTVTHGGQLTDAHVEAWRAGHPSPAAMLAQLRAVARPMYLRFRVAA